jgi:hypothetical protein
MIGVMTLRRANPQVNLTHDNVIQMELAAGFLIHGINPYGADYTNTPLADYNQGKVYGVANPALHHLINLPGHLLLTTGFYELFHRLAGYYDERMLYLLVYLVLLVIASRLGSNETERQRSVILIGLNPLLVPFMIEGRNDVLALTFLVASLLALYNRKRRITAFLFALTFSIKAFAWPFLPFIAVALFVQGGNTFRSRLKSALVPFGIGLVTVTALFGPFLIWNARALFDDIIRYPGGGLATSYPIAGSSIGTTLLTMGVIPSNTSNFPFWMLQAATVIPLLAVFLARLAKKPTVSLLIFSATLVTFTNQYFGRYFHPNHFGFILGCVAIGYGFHMREQAVEPRAPDAQVV